MPGSDISDGSGHSNASSYTSVRLSDGGRQIEDGRRAVPEDAPALFPDAGHGVYDERHNTFYAVDPERQAVAQYDANQGTWTWANARQAANSLIQWVSQNRGRLMQAGRDIAPSALQGVSAFVPGTAGTALNVGGMVGQGLVAANEYRNQYNQYRAGGHVDPVDVAASTGRVLSAAANAAGAALGSDSTVGTRLTGVGTALSTAATTADFVHHAHVEAAQRQADPANQMYALHQNPQLGTGVGQVPPGWNPPSSAPSSASTTSVTPQPPVTAPAGSHLPSGGESSRRAATSGEGSSRHSTHHERHRRSTQESKNKTKGKEVRRK
ncbi:hypothetical protein ACWDO7_03940 [Streptomyces sp. NPDC003656]|uniref:hypothetical protein n=1 Tax=Streptomyces sp. NPDC091385 TaxID=3365997 RepID=UPI0038063791